MQKHLHWFAIAVIGGIMTWVQFNNHYWTSAHLLRWDVYGYSQYLSAGFIYEDIKNPVELEQIDVLYTPAEDKYGRHCINDSCNAVVFKYTMGNAVMMAPFYLAAHVINKWSGKFPADGYSEPYQLSIGLYTLFWALCGLSVLALLLRRWFSPLVTALTLLLIAMGTNYFYYATLGAGMAHIPLFFCMAAALLSMFLWLERRSWTYALLFGIAVGMIALIRLPDLVFGIIPAFLFVQAFFQAEKKDRGMLVMQALCATSVIVLVFLPQMIYWKYVSGHWFFYSYVGERFNFSDPNIVNGLFSYRKGWLLYTPVMIFALAGIPIAIKRMQLTGYAILFFLAINIYMVFSWEQWWYGGGFGARSLIESYAVLSIPLAFVVQWLIERGLIEKGFRKLPGILLSMVFVFFISLNLFQTYQYKRGTLHYDSMDKKAYWGIFGKLTLTNEEYKKLYE